MGAENVIALRARIASDSIEILAGPHNAPAVLRRPEGEALPAGAGAGDIEVAAFFRGESAELLPADDKPPAEAPGEIVLTGHVTQVSYPGGTWRHAVVVGGNEIQVDSETRHEPPARVQVRLPHREAFIFPRSTHDPVTNRLSV